MVSKNINSPCGGIDDKLLQKSNKFHTNFNQQNVQKINQQYFYKMTELKEVTHMLKDEQESDFYCPLMANTEGGNTNYD